MSLGLVVLEEKLFTRTCTPQSDDIKSHELVLHISHLPQCKNSMFHVSRKGQSYSNVVIKLFCQIQDVEPTVRKCH